MSKPKSPHTGAINSQSINSGAVTPPNDELFQILEDIFYGFVAETLNQDETLEVLNKAKQALNHYCQQRIIEELQKINESPAGEYCCDTHHKLVDRIIALKKQSNG
jgi:hypothetical protein